MGIPPSRISSGPSDAKTAGRTDAASASVMSRSRSCSVSAIHENTAGGAQRSIWIETRKREHSQPDEQYDLTSPARRVRTGDVRRYARPGWSVGKCRVKRSRRRKIPGIRRRGDIDPRLTWNPMSR